MFQMSTVIILEYELCTFIIYSVAIEYKIVCLVLLIQGSADWSLNVMRQSHLQALLSPLTASKKYPPDQIRATAVALHGHLKRCRGGEIFNWLSAGD